MQLFIIFVLLVLLLILISRIPPRYRREIVAGEYKKNQAFYLTMRDKTKIAVDLWLPSNLGKDQKIPCLIRATRYLRAVEPGFLMKILAHFGVKDNLQSECEIWEKTGFAVVLVDVRGTGASFGNWFVPWSDEEILDLGEVVDWIVKQPWSNGQVGAYGISYHGNTAELISLNKRKALKLLAPLYSDFDPFQLVFPGGVFNELFIKEWQKNNRLLDLNQTEGPLLSSLIKKLFAAGTKPVDEDRRRLLLKEALELHKQNGDIFAMTSRINYRDDEMGYGYYFDDISPYGKRRRLLEEAGVPMLIYAGWLDACTANGALSRFMTSNTTQHLVIGPWAHGGKAFADPLVEKKPADVTLFSPDHVREWPEIFSRFCFDRESSGLAREIKYYVMGKGCWKSTTVWPPSGVQFRKAYFASNNRLSFSEPQNAGEYDRYEVDYSATTGDHTRWHTQLNGQPVVYADRSTEDRKLLTYTSEPLDTDIEVTGSIIVHLYVSCSHGDCAFHVYFEVVSPEGSVYYVTEGVLRAIHRKIDGFDRSYLYHSFGPYRSFYRRDASLMTPGKIDYIPIELLVTSVIIKKGHRLRVALAGHDASLFRRYPLEGTPSWDVQRNKAYPSHLEIPLMT